MARLFLVSRRLMYWERLSLSRASIGNGLKQALIEHSHPLYSVIFGRVHIWHLRDTVVYSGAVIHTCGTCFVLR